MAEDSSSVQLALVIFFSFFSAFFFWYCCCSFVFLLFSGSGLFYWCLLVFWLPSPSTEHIFRLHNICNCEIKAFMPGVFSNNNMTHCCMTQLVKFGYDVSYSICCQNHKPCQLKWNIYQRFYRIVGHRMRTFLCVFCTCKICLYICNYHISAYTFLNICFYSLSLEFGPSEFGLNEQSFPISCPHFSFTSVFYNSTCVLQ